MIINQYFVLWQVKLDKGFALQAAPPFILLLSVVFALDQNFTAVKLHKLLNQKSVRKIRKYYHFASFKNF